MNNYRDEVLALEMMLDKHTLEIMLDRLSELCFAKAQHIEENWQDKALAKAWSKAGIAIGKLSVTDVIRSVP